jgi:hypothetical protein
MIIFGHLAAKRAELSPGTKITFWRWEVIIPLAFFALIFGMRYGVGVDHTNYLNNYLTGDSNERFELGFSWLTILFSDNNIHFAIYFTVLAFLQVFFFFYAFRNERFLFPYLAFILIAGGYYLDWMNAIRQDLAACIFIYAIQYIDQKKLFKYLIWLAIASLVHKSVIILAVLYPLLRSGHDFLKNIKIQLIILAAALVIHYSGFKIESLLSSSIDFFAGLFQYSSYTIDEIDSMVSVSDTGIGFLAAIIIDILIILYSSKLKVYFNSKRFVIIYILYFIGTISQIIFAGTVVLLRPFRYFSFFKMILAAYLLYFLFKESKIYYNRMVLIVLIIIFLSLLGATIYRGDTNTAKFLFFWQI